MADDQYITLPVETDPDDLAQEGFDYLESVITGFVANPGNVETWLIEAIARIAAMVRDVAADVPKAIFRYLGSTLHGIAPIDDVSATATSTWTMVDDTGYTIPEGTVVSLVGPDNELIAFETVGDVTVDPGNTVTAAGEVVLVASEAGSAANDAVAPVTLVDSLAYVSSIALVAAPSGGTDAETDEEYLDRLSAELQLLTPRPIIPEDFAVLARGEDGVERATAVDGFNPNHNLLTLNQASLETDTTGWVTAGTNCTASRSTSQAKDGTASLRLSSTAAGDMSTTTDTGLGGVTVEPGKVYTASAFARTASVVQDTKVGIRWYDAGGAFISEDLGAADPDAADWTSATPFVTATSPATAAFAAIKVVVLSADGASELHYFDQLQLRRGTSATPWVAGGVSADNNERTISVALIDADGQPVSSGIKTTVDAMLQALREATFIVNIIDPEYTTIDVTFTATIHDGFSAADVITEAEAALADYLDPANWGLPPDGTGESREWINDDTVRYLDIATVINNVDGINAVTVLSLDGGTSDVTLSGAAALPQAGTITGTAA